MWEKDKHGRALSEMFGQQVIVENVGGAGGMTGAARVAKAVPDGYQFVLGGVDTLRAESNALQEGALQLRHHERRQPGLTTDHPAFRGPSPGMMPGGSP